MKRYKSQDSFSPQLEFSAFAENVFNDENVNIGAIQRIFGHENRTTTEIYLHSIGEAEREAMTIYEQLTQDSHTILTQFSHRVSHRKKKDLGEIS